MEENNIQNNQNPNENAPEGVTINEAMTQSAQHAFEEAKSKYLADGNELTEEIEAKLFAQAVELQVLKTPSVAKFGELSQITAIKQKNGVYIVSGVVDSQNSYGAMVRTPFSLKVFLGNDGQWKSADVFVKSGGLGFAGILMGLGIIMDIVSTFFIGGDVDTFKAIVIVGSVIFGIGFLLSFFKRK